MTKPMLVVDGSEVKYLNDIKLIYPPTDGGMQLHMTINHEGVVFDWVDVEKGNIEHTQSFEGDSFHDYIGDMDYDD